MNIKSIVTNASGNFTRAIGKSKLTIKKNSSAILLAFGIGGIITGTIMACKASTELEDIVDAHNIRTEKIKFESDGKTEKEVSRALTTNMLHTAKDVAILYAPAVSVEVAGIACILASHNIMKTRAAAFASAYEAVSQSFRAYRKDIAARYGEETEKSIYKGITQRKITIDNGEDKTELDEANDDMPHGYDIYARRFERQDFSTNSGSTQWDPNLEYDQTFIRCQEQSLNNQLMRDGHLFLNDVYSALGFPKTDYGQYVGWYYDLRNPIGDNQLIIGMTTQWKNYNGKVLPSILLDFNPDGDIMKYVFPGQHDYLN
jgi:hypothetical protein